MAATIQQLDEAVDYYSSLLDFLDDNIPNLDVLIEQFEEEYFKEGEDV